MRTEPASRQITVHRLIVAGARATGAGYPNAEQTLHALRNHGGWEIVDLGVQLPGDFHLWRLVRGTPWRAALQLGKLLIVNFASLVRVLRTRRALAAPVYVPYPSLFFLWYLSWVPARWRPVCIADAYISIWDSLFRDRSSNKRNSLASRLVRAVERRALRTASIVLVDTQANRDRLVADFGLAPARVHSLPLAIDESVFNRTEHSARADGERVRRVLFVGTLIPLHGIAVVLEAMRLLQDDKRIEFRIIGDGQLGSLVEEFLRDNRPSCITWIRDWLPLPKIAEEIANADICLGIFGGDGKAARVLPFKLYMYFAMAKPVISQALLSTPEEAPYPPILALQSVDGRQLADAIKSLVGDPEHRRELEQAGVRYYKRHLSSTRVAARWTELFPTVARR